MASHGTGVTRQVGSEGVTIVLPADGVTPGRFERDGSRPSPREVAHDLRQPMAAVGALVGVVEMNPATPPEVRHHLQQIKSELGLMGQLCQRLLDEVPHRGMRPVRLDRLAGAAASSASFAYERSIQVHAAAVELGGDELELRRALQNLLENACRAAGSEGVVRLVVRDVGECVRLEVHDDGPGFGGGACGSASLGLSIAQLAAEAHGGHLELGRSELGGAAVAIVLPVDPDDRASSRLSATSRPAVARP